GNTNVSGVGLCGHGTAVAGAAAATTNNGIGVASVAWENKILPIRVTDTNCFASDSTFAKGIIYAADHGARVANASFGPPYNTNTLTNAAKYMYDKGGWVVVPGGNSRIYESINDNPYMIAVSATYSTDTNPSWSSYGPYIDFAAPGSGIQTTTMGGSYGGVSGTSFSAPITAGVIALMFSQNPSLTPQQVYDILKQSSVDLGGVGYDIHFGWGRIDAYKALQIVGAKTVDNIAPIAKITNPVDGQIVSGSLGVSVDATDNVGVSSVQLYLDNSAVGVDQTSPYSFTIDTTTLTNSLHTLQAKATDASNNLGSSQTITINVQNIVSPPLASIDPVVSITSPAAYSDVKGKATVSVSASDASGISKVEIYV
ncbi:MAG: S8 family serine peptidase, partial [Nitrososphaerales archaeon]